MKDGVEAAAEEQKYKRTRGLSDLAKNYIILFNNSHCPQKWDPFFFNFVMPSATLLHISQIFPQRYETNCFWHKCLNQNDSIYNSCWIITITLATQNSSCRCRHSACDIALLVCAHLTQIYESVGFCEMYHDAEVCSALICVSITPCICRWVLDVVKKTDP